MSPASGDGDRDGPRALGRRVVVRGLGVSATLAAVGLVPARALAAGIQISSQLERAKVSVGEGVRFVVEVVQEGSGGAVPEPVLPDLGAMGISSRGPMTSSGSSTSWVNGRVSRQSTAHYSYVLIPSKPGSFKLPVHVLVGGKKIAPARIPVLEVVGAEISDEPQAADSTAPKEATSDLFLWLRVDKPSPYVGEQIIYSIELYESLGRRVEMSLSELPSFQDFWTEDLPNVRQRVQTLSGRRFRVHTIFRRALFPQRAGALTIGRPKADIGVMAGPFSISQRLRRVSGHPLKVEVRPLPAEGQPPNFSANNVGNFEIKAEVDRATIKQGEPFTLVVEISGTGNMAAVDPGTWPDLEGMRRYDPKVETTNYQSERIGGVRRYEFLVIPEQAGSLQIPAHTLPYFDPATERYVVASTKPIPIQVEVDPDADPSPSHSQKAAPAADPNAAAGDDGEGLFAPLFEPDGGVPRVEAGAGAGGGRDRFRRWLYGMLGVPAAWGSIAAGRGLWRRFGPDEAARTQAARAARRRALVAEAEAAVESGEGFYAAVSQLLQGAAVDAVGSEGYGLPRRQLQELLRKRGASAEDTEQLGALLDRCDAARFGAGKGASAVDRGALLRDAQALIRKPLLDRRRRLRGGKGGGGG